MSVALSNRAMRLSELVIIYLAAAAPFGVTYFLRQPAHVPRTRVLFAAASTALLWPLALLSRFPVQKKFRRSKRGAPEQETQSPRRRRIDDAERALLSVLYRTEDLAGEAFGAKGEAARGCVRETVACVERYAALTLAVEETKKDAAPSPRETELCRVAGRDGDDLLIAGRCLQRRNVARLRAHHADSRLNLLHALAEMREVFERTPSTQANGAHAPHHVLAALVESYARAIDLLSLLEDERAATSVARLLDAACASLRRAESRQKRNAPERVARQAGQLNVSEADSVELSLPPVASPSHAARWYD